VATAGLIALAVAMGVGRFAFTPILPMLQRDAGLSIAGGSWLASANYVGYFLGALAASAAAARLRPATGIRAGLITIGSTTVAMGLLDWFPAWMVLRALAGVASAFVLVLVSAWSLEQLARAGRPWLRGIVFAGVGTGIAVTGGLCLLLMRLDLGAASAWIGLGVISLAASAATWRAFTADAMARAEERRPGPRAPRPPGGDSARLVLCYGAFGFGYIIPATFLPAMARQAIADPLVFGWSWPIFGAAAALSPPLATAWGHRLSSRRMWMLAHLAMALGLAVVVWRPTIGGILIAALLVGGTFMVITQAGMQEARVVAGPHATRLMAAMTASFAGGQIAGPLIVGYLAGGDGGLSRPLLAACVGLVASALALAVPRQRPDRAAGGSGGAQGRGAPSPRSIPSGGSEREEGSTRATRDRTGRAGAGAGGT
jgi:MFS family permease